MEQSSLENSIKTEMNDLFVGKTCEKYNSIRGKYILGKPVECAKFRNGLMDEVIKKFI